MKKLELPVEELISMYNCGISSYEIAKRFNCSASSILTILNKNGVKTNKTKSSYTTYSVNENYFNTIDTEDKAYFLGLLYADGCVLEKNIMTISLQERDKYILEQFKENLKSNHKLHKKNPAKSHHLIQYSLSISNKKICEDLIKLGCTPRKSLTLKFPTKEQVPEHLIHHFIRGYFDGDGSVAFSKRVINNINYKEPMVSFCGSDFLIPKIINQLKVNNINAAFYVNNSNSNLIIKDKKGIIGIFDFLYKDATIYLNRKYDKFKEIFEYYDSRKFFYRNEKIYQYDLEGNFVKEWENLDDVVLNFFETFNLQYKQCILRNIRGKNKTAFGYIWKI